MSYYNMSEGTFNEGSRGSILYLSKRILDLRFASASIGYKSPTIEMKRTREWDNTYIDEHYPIFILT